MLRKQYAFWCPERWKSLFWASRFQFFLGEHAPRPPMGKGPYGPFSGHSRLLHLQWPLITYVIETLRLIMPRLLKTFSNPYLFLYRTTSRQCVCLLVSLCGHLITDLQMTILLAWNTFRMCGKECLPKPRNSTRKNRSWRLYYWVLVSPCKMDKLVE